LAVEAQNSDHGWPSLLGCAIVPLARRYQEVSNIAS
jgi:hypothetical protein